jgi:hypothetical protein
VLTLHECRADKGECPEVESGEVQIAKSCVNHQRTDAMPFTPHSNYSTPRGGLLPDKAVVAKRSAQYSVSTFTLELITCTPTGE